MSSESHRRMMLRWEEEGIPPDGFPSKPTRIVRKDGSVVILEGDDKLPQPGEPVKLPDPEVVDVGEAVLDPAAADGSP